MAHRKLRSPVLAKSAGLGTLQSVSAGDKVGLSYFFRTCWIERPTLSPTYGLLGNGSPVNQASVPGPNTFEESELVTTRGSTAGVYKTV